MIDDELVQPIIVSASGSHENTVTAVALASVQAWLSTSDNPAWAIWLSQPFAKTVRRMKPARMDRLTNFASSIEVDDSRAVAYAPLHYDEFPPDLARAQVQGTNFPRTEWPLLTDVVPATPYLVVNPDVTDVMSTGKTAAQAAHALMAYLLTRPDEDRVIPEHVAIYRVESSEQFMDVCDRAVAVIRDAGRTEIEPDTATFAAL